jgi:transcriptional regulator with XRE-family HTH domain
MFTHAELKAKALEDPQVQAEYDALAPEFALIDELLKARQRAGLSQQEVAQRMGTLTPIVVRLESGKIKNKRSPSLFTLHQYAQAVGCELEIKLVPRES